jgi:hypothetical protein
VRRVTVTEGRDCLWLDWGTAEWAIHTEDARPLAEALAEYLEREEEL